jgi:hypothetical protein
MRLSHVTLAISVLAGTTVPALAIQDTPTDIGGISTVCTGVGSGKDDPRWASFPVKLVLATPDGQFLAGAHVRLSQGGKVLAETDCDAPWILFSPAPGDYNVTATMLGKDGQPNGQTRSANVTVAGKAQKTVTLTFANQTAAQ